MATVEECRDALHQLAAQLGEGSGGEAPHAGFDRTISAHVTDLDVTFSGRLHDGRIDDITTDPRPRAQVRLRSGSDDLVELAAGRLDLAKAWLSGRVKIEASMTDLLKLRRML